MIIPPSGFHLGQSLFGKPLFALVGRHGFVEQLCSLWINLGQFLEGLVSNEAYLVAILK